MAHVAEIFAVDASLTGRMAEMREWLDGHRFEPTSFRYMQRDGGILILVEFNNQNEASAFIARFGGRTAIPA